MSPNGMDDPAAPYPLIERIRTHIADPRAWEVMEAAYAVFLQYGVRRASMQDIADRAGMSRAALYLHYKSKADIVEALMRAYFDAAADAVDEALAAHDDPSDALIAAFAAQVGDAAEGMMQSPHAEELLSVKQGRWPRCGRKATGVSSRSMPRGLRGPWRREQPDAAVVGPDTSETAIALVAALDGLKSAPFDLGRYRRARDRLARILGLGLSV
jgi:AcrR family transcriptional regulator